jgi:hypothetical protein
VLRVESVNKVGTLTESSARMMSRLANALGSIMLERVRVQQRRNGKWLREHEARDATI